MCPYRWNVMFFDLYLFDCPANTTSISPVTGQQKPDVNIRCRRCIVRRCGLQSHVASQGDALETRTRLISDRPLYAFTDTLENTKLVFWKTYLNENTHLSLKHYSYVENTHVTI